MFFKIRWLISFLLALLLSGCGWRSWDLSKEAPFNAYVGVTGALRNPMTLLEQREYVYSFVPHTIGSSEWDKDTYDEHVVCGLPAGTEIKTTSVKMEERDGGRSIYVLGSVKNTTTDEWVEFEILLGGYWSTGDKEIHVMRMPWEGDDIPEHRYIPLKKPRPGTNPWAK